VLKLKDDEHFEGFFEALEATEQNSVVKSCFQRHRVRDSHLYLHQSIASFGFICKQEVCRAVWQSCHLALHKAKQAFLQAFGLENFDLALWHFLAFWTTLALKI